ncbi:Rad4 beta-hairpin domain 3 [Phytophthora cactorum]|nr:Rad4 beta-hairpin domain 3 [Phytophthora cactorum]
MRQQPLSYSLELLVRWFNREYKISDEVEEYATQGELITESSLMNVFFARQGRDYELAVLFAALCGALQLRYRLTCALDPLLVQKGKTFEASFKQRPNKRRRAQNVADRLKKKLLSGDAEEKREVDEELEPESTGNVRRVFWLWCEVLDEKHKNWIHVDAVRRLVNRPQEVEPLRGKAARFSYVVSIQDDGLLVDVTSRYTVQWSKSLELRLADSWLKRSIERFNEDTTDQRPVTEAAARLVRPGDVENALVQEKKKLETLKLAEGMPTSLEGFRKHHLYILERHLGQFECLHPRKVIGLFKGQPVFLREHVQPLRSAFKWRRLGREVKESERQKPAKWQSKGSDPGGGDDSDEALQEGKPSGSLAFFGLWQTTEFEPPPMSSPRPSRSRSPASSRIDAIAESLGIDFAPAVVGFEVRNGRPMPKMSGIVVAQSHEEMLLDAHAERQQQAIEKAIAHNQKLVLKRWEKLTKRPRQETSQLLDRFGRAHTYLRISLTERCNLRCRYCMPEDGVPLQPTEELLTTSEITRLAKVFASSGVKRIRLTGGEPLLRRDLVELVAQIRAIPGIESVGITTNGITLQKKLLALQQAGVDRLNVSLDTLKPDKFAHITRRQGFTRVMNSILEAQTLGFSPLKINCVVQRRFNLDEVVDFVAFTEKHAVDVRFIEWMPFDSNRWNDETFVPFKEMMGLIQAEFPLVEKLPDGTNDTSKAFHVPGFKGQFGFITSMSEHFCGSCNRLRLTADGNLKVCLFGNTEVSLRDAMRYNIADNDIRDIVDVAVKRKKFALGGHGDMYGLSKAKNRPMVLIGG